MERIWLFVGAIAVFAARDALAAASRPRSAYALAALALPAGFAAGGLGAALSAAEIDDWLGRPAFWAGGLALHAGLALWSLRRAGKAAAGGLVEMLPSPVFAVALVLIVRLALERTNALSGLQAGAAAAAGYLLLVAALAAGFRKAGFGKTAAAGSGRFRMAALSHLTAFLLVPASAVSTGEGSAQGNAAASGGEAGAVWAAALGALLVTALSFARHRLRSRNATLSRSR